MAVLLPFVLKDDTADPTLKSAVEFFLLKVTRNLNYLPTLSVLPVTWHDQAHLFISVWYKDKVSRYDLLTMCKVYVPLSKKVWPLKRASSKNEFLPKLFHTDHISDC